MPTIRFPSPLLLGLGQGIAEIPRDVLGILELQNRRRRLGILEREAAQREQAFQMQQSALGQVPTAFRQLGQAFTPTLMPGGVTTDPTALEGPAPVTQEPARFVRGPGFRAPEAGQAFGTLLQAGVNPAPIAQTFSELEQRDIEEKRQDAGRAILSHAVEDFKDPRKSHSEVLNRSLSALIQMGVLRGDANTLLKLAEFARQDPERSDAFATAFSPYLKKVATNTLTPDDIGPMFRLALQGQSLYGEAVRKMIEPVLTMAIPDLRQQSFLRAFSARFDQERRQTPTATPDQLRRSVFEAFERDPMTAASAHSALAGGLFPDIATARSAEAERLKAEATGALALKRAQAERAQAEAERAKAQARGAGKPVVSLTDRDRPRKAITNPDVITRHQTALTDFASGEFLAQLTAKSATDPQSAQAAQEFSDSKKTTMTIAGQSIPKTEVLARAFQRRFGIEVTLQQTGRGFRIVSAFEPAVTTRSKTRRGKAVPPSETETEDDEGAEGQ